MSDLLATSARMSVVLGAALIAMPLLRRQSASLRAWVLFSALACAAFTPVLGILAPAWGPGLESAASLPATDARGVILVVWVLGMTLHLLVVLTGLVRLMGVAAAADPIREGRCADMALEIAAEYGVHAPVLLLEADRATLPVTWGHREPKVLLPPAARTWSEERAAAVLRHELAHVRRRDWLVHLIARSIRSVFWFHPLVWLVCRRLHLESERACDDAVLRSGVRGPQYASHLLDLARAFVDARQLRSASSFAGQSALRQRVQAMLTPQNRRAVGCSRGAVVTLGLLVLTGTVAGYGATAAPDDRLVLPPPRRLTLLLDGRIVDLAKEWPTYPDPRAGVVEGPGLRPVIQLP